MNWHNYKQGITRRRWLPPEKRYVLVHVNKSASNMSDILAVGYLKFAAGDKNCPYFVVPGIGGEVVAWSDCLGDDFRPPRCTSGNSEAELND